MAKAINRKKKCGEGIHEQRPYMSLYFMSTPYNFSGNSQRNNMDFISLYKSHTNI